MIVVDASPRFIPHVLPDGSLFIEIEQAGMETKFVEVAPDLLSQRRISRARVVEAVLNELNGVLATDRRSAALKEHDE